MLSGKAIARALRAHFIVDAALNALMLKSVLNVPLPCQPEVSKNEDPDLAETAARPSDEQCADVGKNLDLDEACTLYEKLMARDICAEEVCKFDEFDVLKRIKDSLQKYSESEDVLQNFSTLGSVYEHDGHPTQIHQSRAYWKLGITFTGYPGHASLHGSLRP